MKSIVPLNICIQALNDLKAQNLLTLDISKSSNFSDWFANQSEKFEDFDMSNVSKFCAFKSLSAWIQILSGTMLFIKGY